MKINYRISAVMACRVVRIDDSSFEVPHKHSLTFCEVSFDAAAPEALHFKFRDYGGNETTWEITRELLSLAQKRIAVGGNVRAFQRIVPDQASFMLELRTPDSRVRLVFDAVEMAQVLKQSYRLVSKRRERRSHKGWVPDYPPLMSGMPVSDVAVVNTIPSHWRRIGSSIGRLRAVLVRSVVHH